MTCGDEVLRQMRADEPCASGDEISHMCCEPSDKVVSHRLATCDPSDARPTPRVPGRRDAAERTDSVRRASSAVQPGPVARLPQSDEDRAPRCPRRYPQSLCLRLEPCTVVGA